MVFDLTMVAATIILYQPYATIVAGNFAQATEVVSYYGRILVLKCQWLMIMMIAAITMVATIILYQPKATIVAGNFARVQLQVL